MDISIPGGALSGIILGILIAVVGFIFLMRYMLSKGAEGGLAEKYAGQPSKSPLAGRTKYPDADAFGLSGTFFNLGLVVSIGLTILAFSWTQYEEIIDIPEDALELEDDIEIEPPRTAEPPPPPPQAATIPAAKTRATTVAAFLVLIARSLNITHLDDSTQIR